MRPREAISERDPYCWHCGATEGLQTHHRQNRGMGGSKQLDTPQNLIRICAPYNFAMESDHETAAKARQRGHKLSKWDDLDTPLLDVPRGQWFRLTADGGKTLVNPLRD